jgi:hypothetical protein
LLLSGTLKPLPLLLCSTWKRFWQRWLVLLLLLVLLQSLITLLLLLLSP